MIQIRLAFLSFLFFFFIQLNAQENVKIVNINFSGNDSISDEALLNIMNTKTLSLIQKLEFWKTNYFFSPYTLKSDLIRLKKYYQQNGFMDPIITSELIPSKNKKKLKIHIYINQGKAILNGEIKYYLSNDSILNITEYPKVIPQYLKSGQRFRDENVILTKEKILEFYNSNAYPYAHVSNE